MVESPYVKSYRAHMDAFAPGLWRDPRRIAKLDAVTARLVLDYLLGLACNGQNIAPITIARSAICEIPRPWLLSNIEVSANDCLDLGDYWVYRRLLELYSLVDQELVRRLVPKGLTSADPEIRQAAHEFKDGSSRS